MATVEFRQIRKSYGTVEIVKGVDLEVADGEFVVLVGPSGCGKSTLLRMIAGLEEVTSGELLIDEKVVNDVSARDRDIAMVFQSYALYPHMTVRRNMGFALEVRKTPRAEVDEQVNEAANMLGLENLLDRYPKQLSGGQRQRVAMGRAIVRRPKVFLFDEPLSNLDAALRAQMRVELARLHRKLGTTMLYVTHDQVEAMTLADRIAVVNNGILQHVGPPQELYDKPKNRFVAHFIGSPSMNFLEARLERSGESLVARNETRNGKLELTLSPDKIVDPGEPGRKLLVGVRPHDFHITAEGMNDKAEANPTTGSPYRSGSGGGLEAVVDVIEPMGWEALLYLNFNDETIIVHSEAEPVADLEPGQTVTLNVAPEQIHLFDADDERSLAWP